MRFTAAFLGSEGHHVHPKRSVYTQKLCLSIETLLIFQLKDDEIPFENDGLLSTNDEFRLNNDDFLTKSDDFLTKSDGPGRSADAGRWERDPRNRLRAAGLVSTLNAFICWSFKFV